jgi:hypothetical protein
MAWKGRLCLRPKRTTGSQKARKDRTDDTIARHGVTSFNAAFCCYLRDIYTVLP